jgi:hypothetical protein
VRERANNLILPPTPSVCGVADRKSPIGCGFSRTEPQRPCKAIAESAKDDGADLTNLFVKTLNANVLASEKKHAKKR